MSKDILVYIEVRDGQAMPVSYELLGIGRELANIAKCKLIAGVVSSSHPEIIEDLKKVDVDEVVYVNDASLKHYLTDNYASALGSIIEAVEPNVILVGATTIGRDLAPRLSSRLHTGLTADCTKLEIDETGLLFSTRPAFGGNLIATIVNADHKPQMSTVRPGVMHRIGENTGRKVEVKEIKYVAVPSRIEFVEEVVEQKTCGSKIEDAKILVSMGRGIVNQANMKLAEELACELGGTHSSTRALVDEGKVDHERQVGQTGKTVRPELYLALGISGAIQHVVGMEHSGYIVAVNKDKDAPIFKVSDLGIIGDVNKILPLLKEELEKIL